MSRTKQWSVEELSDAWNSDRYDEYIQIDDGFNSAAYISGGRRKEEISSLGKRITFTRNGIKETKYEDCIFKGIRRWMEEKQFWPNIWHVNERGNIELYTARGKSLGGLV